MLWGQGVLEEEVLEYRTHLEMTLIAPTIEDSEGMLDALADIVYFAVGIAIERGWDFEEAFRRVHEANMAKELAGASANKRQSPTDLIKPHGWKAASMRDLVEERTTTVGDIACETNGSNSVVNLPSEQRTYSLLEIARSSAG